jgi:hypothetical protein
MDGNVSHLWESLTWKEMKEFFRRAYLGNKMMEIYKCKQNSNESGLAFLYRFLNVNANTEAKILRPRDSITLFIENLTPNTWRNSEMFGLRTWTS